MKREVTIIDYGMGNLLSVTRAFSYCGANIKFAHTTDDIRKASKLVLPGVGAFSDGMKELESRDMILPLQEYAQLGKQLLGICLGMQMLLDKSEEFGNWEGLGIIPGKVIAIQDIGTNGQKHKIPHIGWNELVKPEATTDWKNSLLNNNNEKEAFYFVHSYMANPDKSEHRLADCDYNGIQISAVIENNNIMGCQFHPEKSGANGLKIIKRFVNGL